MGNTNVCTSNTDHQLWPWGLLHLLQKGHKKSGHASSTTSVHVTYQIRNAKHQWYSKSKHAVLPCLRSLQQLLDLDQAVLCILPDRFQFRFGYDFKSSFSCTYWSASLHTRNTFYNWLLFLLFQLQLLLSSNSFTENISKALDTKEDVQDNAKRIAVSGMTSRSVHVLLFYMILRPQEQSTYWLTLLSS